MLPLVVGAALGKPGRPLVSSDFLGGVGSSFFGSSFLGSSFLGSSWATATRLEGTAQRNASDRPAASKRLGIMRTLRRCGLRVAAVRGGEGRGPIVPSQMQAPSVVKRDALEPSKIPAPGQIDQGGKAGKAGRSKGHCVKNR